MKQSFESLMEDAEKARAYIQTTAQHGPSKQLLDFINYDGNLFSDLGLESLGLETMSLTTQHEMLLSKLNPDHLEEMAMEDLDSTIDTTTKYLTGISSIGAIVAAGSGDYISGPTSKIIALSLGVLASAAQTIRVVNSKTNRHILSYSDYRDMTKAFDTMFKLDRDIVSKLPHDFELSSWKRFDDGVDSVLEKYDDRTELLLHTSSESVPFSKSGWTDAKFKEVIRWYTEHSKQVAKLAETHAAQYEKINSFYKTHKNKWFGEKRKLVKYINKTANYSKHSFANTVDVLKEINHVITRLEHHFEIVE